MYFNQSKGIGWCHYCKRTVRRKDVSVDEQSDFLLEMFLPGGFRSTDRALAGESSRALQYLCSRWVDAALANQVGILYSYERDAISVPIHSPALEFPRSYQTRSISPGGHWYTEAKERKEYCFGLPWIPPNRKEILLVEGIFDVLSPGWLGYAIATLGTTLSDTLCLFLASRFSFIHIFYDPDMAGRSGSGRVLHQIRMAGCMAECVRASIEPGDMGPAHPLATEWRNKLDLL